MIALLIALAIVPGLPVAVAVRFCRNNPRRSDAPNALDSAVLPGWRPQA